MARKTIKNRTYTNFMTVYNAVIREKGYDKATAGQITRNLFETLEYNPGGDIWFWFDNILTAEEYNREYA